ncbi:MAG TPA: hypothetical protein VL053_20235 [Arachidicoccus sp.]|nr:hypothetical protein [Arachidicoccus sp.]
MKFKSENGKVLLANRISEILDKIELTPEGLAAFLNINKKTLGPIKHGKHGIDLKKQVKLASAYSLTMKQFLDPDYILPDILTISDEMRDFMKESELSGAYFKTEIAKNKTSLVIKRLIDSTDFFDKPVTNAEILAECDPERKVFSIQQVNSVMTHLKNTNKINGERRPVIKKKDGKPSTKGLWYYWK